MRGSGGPGQFTIGLGAAGAAHIENAEAVETTIRRKLSQHTGLTDPLVIVLDPSSPLIDDSEIAAMLYGPVAITMLEPATVLSVARDRTKGIWPQSLTRPPRPTAVLVLREVWLASHEVSADATDLPQRTCGLSRRPKNSNSTSPEQAGLAPRD